MRVGISSLRSCPKCHTEQPGDGDRPLDGRPPRICVVTVATRTHFLTTEEVPTYHHTVRRTVGYCEPFTNPDTRAQQGNYQGRDGVCKLIGYPPAARAVS